MNFYYIFSIICNYLPVYLSIPEAFFFSCCAHLQVTVIFFFFFHYFIIMARNSIPTSDSLICEESFSLVVEAVSSFCPSSLSNCDCNIEMHYIFVFFLDGRKTYTLSFFIHFLKFIISVVLVLIFWVGLLFGRLPLGFGLISS